MTQTLMQYLPSMVQQAPVPQTAPQAPQPSQFPAQSGADKYFGGFAEAYDKTRESEAKWIIEQTIIEGMIGELAEGSRVLDCPVGTGRFLKPYIAKKLQFIGIDKAGDKLYIAARKLAGGAAKRWVDDCDAWIARIKKLNDFGQPILDEKGQPVVTGETVRVEVKGDNPPAVGTDVVVNGRPGILGVSEAKLQPVDIEEHGTLAIGDVRDTKLPDRCVDAAVNCRISRWLSPEDCQKMLREMQRVARKRIVWTARIANHVHARTVELFEAALQPGWKITRNEVGIDMDYRVLMAERV